MNGIDLTKGSIIKKLAIVSTPIIVANLFQSLYSLTDMFWLGQVSQEALSAVGAMGLLIWFGVSIFTISKVSVEVKVSQAFGRKNSKEVNEYATNGLLLTIVIALLYSGGLFIFRETIIDLFNFNSIEIIRMAKEYLDISVFAIFLLLLMLLYMSVYNGIGNTKIAFIFLAISLLINIILDPILILKFGLGVKGASIATLIAIVIGNILFWFYSKYKGKEFINFISNIDLKKIGELINLGFFPMVTQLFFCTSFIIMSIFVVRFGDENIAVSQIGSQIESLTWIVGAAVTTSVTVFTGQNIGAKLHCRISKGVSLTLIVMILYSILVSVTFVVFGEKLYLLFLPNEIQTAKLGETYLYINAYVQAFMMAEAVITGFFNGQSKTKVPAFSSITGNIIRIILFFILGSKYGVNGVWAALAISIAIKGIILTVALVVSVAIHDDYKFKDFLLTRRVFNVKRS